MNKFEAAVKIYDQAIDLIPEVERKGKNLVFTSDNERMYSQVNKEGQIGIRLSKEDREAFRAAINPEPFITYNTNMKEYVLVPESMMEKPEEIARYIKAGYEYVMAMPPKKKK